MCDITKESIEQSILTDCPRRDPVSLLSLSIIIFSQVSRAYLGGYTNKYTSVICLHQLAFTRV